MYVTYQITFLKQLLKKTLEPTEENPNMKETCVDKIISIIRLLYQSDGQNSCCY